MSLEKSSLILRPIKVWKIFILIFILSLTFVACRPAPPPPEEIEIVTSPLPTEEVDISGTAVISTPLPVTEPGADTPTSQGDQTSTPTPTVKPIEIGPLGTPTRLPEPRVIKVLDWELVRSQAPELCAGCGPSRIVVAAPRTMGIVLVRIFNLGDSSAKLTISTDLAYASPLACEVSADDSYCGAIFGQIVDGKVMIMSELVEGTPGELIYYLTFQRWADYAP